MGRPAASQDKPDQLRYAEDHFFAELSHANETKRAEMLALPGLEERLAKARQEGDEAFLRRFRRARQGKEFLAGVANAEKFAVQDRLELPRGLPGLCFFSDAAADSLLKFCGLRPGKQSATKQLRVRLGLIQAGTKPPLH